MTINNIIKRIYQIITRSFIVYIYLFNFNINLSHANARQDLDSARRKQITAYAEFYQGVKDLGLNPQKDKYIALKRRTVDAAQFGWTQATQNFLVESKKDLMKQITVILIKHSPGFKWLDSTPSEKKPNPTKSTIPTPSQQNPELILDGSKILKEIEFSRKHQNVAPPIPEMTVEGEGHTDTIEFAPKHPYKNR